MQLKKTLLKNSTTECDEGAIAGEGMNFIDFAKGQARR